MPRFVDRLLRILTGEPWSERREGERRSPVDWRGSTTEESVEDERRHKKRRQGDRRGIGWIRFWNPP